MHLVTRNAMPFTVALLAAIATPTLAQQPVVNFKTLQQFLPSVELPGYARGKLTGSTSSAMGVSTSEAKVVYTRQGQQSEETGPPTITVTITDIGGNPLGAFAAMAEAMAGEVNEETEEGYKKSITLQTRFKGMEEATTTKDNKSCKINLTVGKRFTVDVEGYLTDQAALLHQLIDSMKLEALERAAPAKSY